MIEKRMGATTWEYIAPIHICGHCPHPSNHGDGGFTNRLFLPHSLHRNERAVQSTSC